ncbi:MAG: hypothetical protein HN368_09840, partial [Spirochaetales bacterium]|nr:hypothetical protein [Spirochaetales bacterium]
MKKKAILAAGILVIPSVWYLASLAVGTFAVPAPWTSIADTVTLFGDAETYKTISITIGRVLFGFSAALVLGT